MRYVSDTLHNYKDINHINKCLSYFDKNMEFTVDTFPEGNVHFPDIIIAKNHTDISYKDTHTGQYTSFHSQTLMSWNAYLKYVCNYIIKRLKSNVYKMIISATINMIKKVLWINLPYLGKKGEQLTNFLMRKLKRFFEENVKFKMVYKTNKL